MKYLFLTLLVFAGLGYLYPGAAIPAGQAETGQLERLPSPDGRWVAIIDRTAGSLALEDAAGDSLAVFPEGSTVFEVKWSPDSRRLLVVRTNWILPRSSNEGVQSSGPIAIWQVSLEDNQARPPSLVYQSGTPAGEGPQQIVFGRWAPDGRFIVFWEGILSASIRADGLPLYVLDTGAGEVIPLGETSLTNLNYHSWAPDSSTLAVTSGSYRSAQVNKWLNLLDVGAGRATTVISQTEQIPGFVAWSPQGDQIAYAAVPAAETGPEWADLMTFDNPAIAGRRIYLLDPATGQYRRLNRANSYQDAPAWANDGQRLCYVQAAGDTVELMVADPATGQAEPVPGLSLSLPEMAGYYGLSDWSELLNNCPGRITEASPDKQLTLAELRNATYPLEYPADGTAELADGAYQEPSRSSSAFGVTVEFNDVVFGDLDGDGLEDAAVVLVSNTGGSGVFFDLVAVLNHNGRPAPVASTLLGDRIDLQSLAITDGAIEVHMITQGLNDPLCCPTQEVTRRYTLQYALAETEGAGER